MLPSHNLKEWKRPPKLICYTWPLHMIVRCFKTISNPPSVKEKYYPQHLVANLVDNTTPLASSTKFLGNWTSNSLMRPSIAFAISKFRPHCKTFTLIRLNLNINLLWYSKQEPQVTTCQNLARNHNIFVFQCDFSNNSNKALKLAFQYRLHGLYLWKHIPINKWMSMRNPRLTYVKITL